MINKGFLHYIILKHIIDKGFAPGVNTLSQILNLGIGEVTEGLYALQEDHGVVLHPKEPKIWSFILFLWRQPISWCRLPLALGGVIAPGVHWALLH
jgi:hypothetical protein